MIRRLLDLPERAVEAFRGMLLPVHPLQIDVLKAIACVCMLIDHINTCLFDRASVWAWLIGRLAFPLFSFTFVVTLTESNALRTAKRTAAAGVLVQPIYAVAFADAGFSPWWAGNILISFAVVAYLVELVKALTWSNIVQAVALLMLASVVQAPSSFGVAGIAFMLALWFTLHRVAPCIGSAVAAVAFLNLNPGALAVSVSMALALVLILFASGALRASPPRRLLHPRATLWFYAGHLAVIGSLVSSF
ncbi:TraX family protein [Methyloversatilis thermotolerans]|uniref:TraX family protein n=1 Tax=Methyloversatilis thermotolerans TaxID=1346290 RepID=UPI0012F75BFC|nr:TraX family protein [Methyloversatilis thermotolerans]